MYLYQEKWSQAAGALDQLINSNNYSLTADYSTIFLKENENNAETVFDVEYSADEGGLRGV